MLLTTIPKLYFVLSSEVLIVRSIALPSPEILFSFKPEIKVAPSIVPIANPTWNSPVDFSSTSISKSILFSSCFISLYVALLNILSFSKFQKVCELIKNFNLNMI